MSDLLYNNVIGEGEPLILLHGLFGMGDNLSMIARPMAEHYQVHRLDLRNHGRSFRSSSMSFAEMADDVLAVMDAQGIDKAHLLGHSLGGKVAMQLALQQPQRVNKLVVADIAPVAYYGNHDAVFAGLNAVDLNIIQSRRDADGVLKQHIEEEGVRLFILKSLYKTDQGRYDWRLNVDAIQQCYEQLRSANHADKPFNGPTLFIKGELSNYIKADYKEAIDALFTQASFKVIENTGHWLHAEKTVTFNKLVEDFLAG